jgi:hypothetical protein
MWQRLQSITDYKIKTSPVADHKVLLPDRLNNLFAHFEDNTVPLTRARYQNLRLSFTAANVRKHLNVLTLARLQAQYVNGRIGTY